jgi:hypothetical protein
MPSITAIISRLFLHTDKTRRTIPKKSQSNENSSFSFLLWISLKIKRMKITLPTIATY